MSRGHKPPRQPRVTRRPIHLEPLEDRVLLTLIGTNGIASVAVWQIAGATSPNCGVSVSGGTVDVTISGSGIATLTLVDGNPSVRTSHAIGSVVEDTGAFNPGGFDVNGDNLTQLLTGASVSYGIGTPNLSTGVPTTAAGTIAGNGIGGIGSINLPTANITGSVVAPGAAIGSIVVDTGDVRVTDTYSLTGSDVNDGAIKSGADGMTTFRVNNGSVYLGSGYNNGGNEITIIGSSISTFFVYEDIYMPGYHAEINIVSSTTSLIFDVNGSLFMTGYDTAINFGSLGSFDVEGYIVGNSSGTASNRTVAEVNVTGEVFSFEVGINEVAAREMQSWRSSSVIRPGDIVGRIHFNLAKTDAINIFGSVGNASDITADNLAEGAQQLVTFDIEATSQFYGQTIDVWGNFYGIVEFNGGILHYFNVHLGNFGGQVNVQNGSLGREALAGPETWGGMFVAGNIFTDSVLGSDFGYAEFIRASTTIYELQSYGGSILGGLIQAGDNIGRLGTYATGWPALFGGVHARGAVYADITATNNIYGISAGVRADIADNIAPEAVAVGDFNGDGIMDMVVTNYYDGTVSIYLGSGAGTRGGPDGVQFGEPLVMAVGTNPVDVLVGNFNPGTTASEAQDPYLDILVLNQGSGTVSYLKGKGDGTFELADHYNAGGAGVNAFAVGNLNGDLNGYLDVVTVNSLTGMATRLIGSGIGTTGNVFTAGGSTRLGQQGTDFVGYTINSAPSDVAVADLDGDGNLDIIATLTVDAVRHAGYMFNTVLPTRWTTTSQYGTVSILHGTGGGGFAATDDYDLLGPAYPASGYTNSVGKAPSSLAVTDLTGDGNPDVAITVQALTDSHGPTGTHPTTGYVQILANAGGGGVDPGAGNRLTFHANDSYTTRNGPDSLIATEVAGDGDSITDLVWVNVLSGRISLRRGTGSAVPGAILGGRSDYYTGDDVDVYNNVPTSVVSTDFNNDGYQDLAVVLQRYYHEARTTANDTVLDLVYDGGVAVLLGTDNSAAYWDSPDIYKRVDSLAGLGPDGVLGTADDVSVSTGGIGWGYRSPFANADANTDITATAGTIYYMSAAGSIIARVNAGQDLGWDRVGLDGRAWTQDDTIYGIFSNANVTGTFNAGRNITVVNADLNVGDIGIFNNGTAPQLWGGWDTNHLATRIYAQGSIHEVSANGIASSPISGGDIAACIRAEGVGLAEGEAGIWYVFAGDDILSAEYQLGYPNPVADIEISSGAKIKWIIANDSILGAQYWDVASGEVLPYTDNLGQSQWLSIGGTSVSAIVVTAFGVVSKVQLSGSGATVDSTDYIGDVSSFDSISRVRVGIDPGANGTYEKGSGDDVTPSISIGNADGLVGTNDDITSVRATGRSAGVFRVVAWDDIADITTSGDGVVAVAAMDASITRIRVIDGNIGAVMAVGYNGVGQRFGHLGGVFTVASGLAFGDPFRSHDFLNAASIAADIDIGTIVAVSSDNNPADDPEDLLVGGLVGSIAAGRDISTVLLNWVGPGNEVNAYASGGLYTIFEEPADYSSGGSQAVALAAGDFNGSGGPDLAVVNSGSNAVAVLFNNGSGAFPAVSGTYAVGANPVAIAAGYLDEHVLAGTRSLDLVVANHDAGTISVLLNNGAGGFTVATYPISALPDTELLTDVALGDFNADGYTDVAVTDERYNVVWLILNNGDGTFTNNSGLSYNVGYAPSSLAVADFNGDGALDIATANYSGSPGYGSGTVSVLLGRGDATFQPQQVFSVGSNPIDLAVGDFDEDWDPDLVVVNEWGDDLSVLIGQGDGTFFGQSRMTVDGTRTPFQPYGVAVFDYNGDGHQDLAVANRGVDTVTVFVGDGDGHFFEEDDYPVAEAPQKLVVADFDRDGRADLATANAEGGSADVSVLLRSRYTRVYVANSSASSQFAEMTRVSLHLPTGYYFDVEQGRSGDGGAGGVNDFHAITIVRRSSPEVDIVSQMFSTGLDRLTMTLTGMTPGAWFFFDVDIDNKSSPTAGNTASLAAGALFDAEFRDGFYGNYFTGSTVVTEGVQDFAFITEATFAIANQADDDSVYDRYGIFDLEAGVIPAADRAWGWAHAANGVAIAAGDDIAGVALYRGTEAPGLTADADLKAGCDPSQTGNIDRLIVGRTSSGVSDPKRATYVQIVAAADLDVYASGRITYMVHTGDQYSTVNAGAKPFTSSANGIGILRVISGDLLAEYIVSRGDVDKMSVGYTFGSAAVGYDQSADWLQEAYVAIGGNLTRLVGYGDMSVDMFVGGTVTQLEITAGDLDGDVYVVGNVSDYVRVNGTAFTACDLNADLTVIGTLKTVKAYVINGDVTARSISTLEAYGFDPLTGDSVTGNVTTTNNGLTTFKAAGNVTSVVSVAAKLTTFTAGQTSRAGEVTRVGNVTGVIVTGRVSAADDTRLTTFSITGKVDGGEGSTPAQVIVYGDISSFKALAGLYNAVVAAKHDIASMTVGGIDQSLVSAGFGPGADGRFAVANAGVDDVVVDARGSITTLIVQNATGAIRPTRNVQDSIIRATDGGTTLRVLNGNWIDSILSLGYSYGADLSLGTADDVLQTVANSVDLTIKPDNGFGTLTRGGVITQDGRWDNILQASGSFQNVRVEGKLGAAGDRMRAGEDILTLRTYDDIFMDLVAGDDIGTVLIQSTDGFYDGRLVGDLVALGATGGSAITSVRTEGVDGGGRFFRDLAKTLPIVPATLVYDIDGDGV